MEPSQFDFNTSKDAIEMRITSFFNALQDGEAKSPTPLRPYQFSHGNYKNVGISLQNFLTFSFNPFATLV